MLPKKLRLSKDQALRGARADGQALDHPCCCTMTLASRGLSSVLGTSSCHSWMGCPHTRPWLPVHASNSSPKPSRFLPRLRSAGGSQVGRPVAAAVLTLARCPPNSVGPEGLPGTWVSSSPPRLEGVVRPRGKIDVLPLPVPSGPPRPPPRRRWVRAGAAPSHSTFSPCPPPPWGIKFTPDPPMRGPMGPGPISFRPGPSPPLSEAPAAPQEGGSGRQPPHGALGQRAAGSMFSPDGGLPAAPFGLLTDAGSSFPRGSFDGAPAQPLFFPFAATAEPEPARDPPPARAWLPPPVPAPPAKVEARPGRPCSQPEPEPRAAACCGPAWPPPPWAGPAPSGPAALPGPPFPGPAAPAFPGPQLCPSALQPGSGGPSGLGSSGSSSGAASEGGHSSDSGEEVRPDGTGTGTGRVALPRSRRLHTVCPWGFPSRLEPRFTAPSAGAARLLSCTTETCRCHLSGPAVGLPREKP